MVSVIVLELMGPTVEVVIETQEVEAQRAKNECLFMWTALQQQKNCFSIAEGFGLLSALHLCTIYIFILLCCKLKGWSVFHSSELDKPNFSILAVIGLRL